MAQALLSTVVVARRAGPEVQAHPILKGRGNAGPSLEDRCSLARVARVPVPAGQAGPHGRESAEESEATGTALDVGWSPVPAFVFGLARHCSGQAVTVGRDCPPAWSILATRSDIFSVSMIRRFSPVSWTRRYMVSSMIAMSSIL